MSSNTSADNITKVMEELLGMEFPVTKKTLMSDTANSICANPTANPQSVYPRLPASVVAYHDLATDKVVIDIEAYGSQGVNVTMFDGKIISAKNEDGTDSDMFQP